MPVRRGVSRSVDRFMTAEQRFDAADVELVFLTSVIDNRAHVVTDVELTSPHAMRTGRYEALCGHLISPAPLIEPDGARCPRCDERDRALRPAPSAGRRARRLGRLRP